MTVWIDDGCGFEGTEAEVEAHIAAQGFDDVSKIVCWGYMEKGSPVHLELLAGRHPMEMVVEMVGNAMLDHAPLFKGEEL